MTATLRVAFAGPHVSVQDWGRPGFMRFGVPHSGPMDRLGFAAALAAAGLPPDAAGIEVSAGGLVLDCAEGEVGFAVAGGGFLLRHQGKLLPSWHRGTLRAGDRLEIRPGSWGSWSYLVLAGVLEAKRWLGSASTHSQSGFGGGGLTAGEALVVSDCHALREGPIPVPVFARPHNKVRATLGPQEQFFPQTAIAAIEGTDFTLTGAYDRMGWRLAGPDMRPEGALDIPSGPVARGSVQVSGDGVATILMADHQTTGGYPRIATVIDADLDLLAQHRPGQMLRFQMISAENAQATARLRLKTVAAYLRGLTRP